MSARLPSPALHGAALGGVSAALACLATIMLPTFDFSAVVRATLAAIGSSVGASALAMAVVPAGLRRLNVSHAQASRYASATALPLAVSGCSVLMPDLPTSFVAIALLSAIAYRSGSNGAVTFLALRGADKRRAAALASLAPTLPALLLVPLNAAR